ncbi:MAG: polyprenyl synthetase family protein [Christensenella sp.]|nr:polyprenyl synthetase family protein [Christensenella sp.]
MSNYWIDYPDLQSELDAVRQFMLDSISDAIPLVKEPLTEVIESGGKMLRPAMVILGAKLGKYKSDRVIPIAACVELLHTATLIHDDIIDESKLRRGIETVHSKYSKEVAVLVGDYVFAKTFDLLAGDYPAEMLKKLSHSIMKICEGELYQYSYRYSDTLSLDQYLEIIAGKTAALFSMSLFAGAYEAGTNNQTQRALVQAGYCIGMTFQIIDDCLDYLGKPSTIGKNVANDIKKGDITLPVLFALTNETSGTLSNLVFNSGLTTEDIASIRSLVIENRGVTLAEEKAWEYGQDALKALEKVKKSESRKILEKIVSSILETTRK